MSRLARALWIEIRMDINLNGIWTCRGSREPCGLKSFPMLHIGAKD